METAKPTKGKAVNPKEARALTAEEAHGIPGVWETRGTPGVHTRIKVAKMFMRAQGLGARAHAASAAATPPKSKAGMFGLQQV